MNIVVLDGYTLNPGDLSWEPITSCGSCKIYDRTTLNEIAERAGDAEIILTNKTVLNRPTILNLKKLRYIGVLATGYNVVDIAATKEAGIFVTNIPSYGTDSVAQMVFAHLLELTQHIGAHSDSVRKGKWASSPDFCYWDFPLIELNLSVMGIIGFGRIGQQVAKIANAFGMKIMAHEPSSDIQKTRPDINFVDLDKLFHESDVISLHCPLTQTNHNLVNAQRLGMMKPSALLINTSRGPLIDELALAEALNKGKIAGAGLDVLGIEPPNSDNPLFKARNCFITPHIAWATQSARGRLMKTAAENIKAFLNGTPQNVVN